MNNTIGFIGVIISMITTGVMLNNSIHGRLDVMQGDIDSLREYVHVSNSETRSEISALRSSVSNEFNIIRSDIKDLQNRMSSIESRTSSIEGKLALLIEAWDIALPSPPAIAKQ